MVYDYVVTVVSLTGSFTYTSFKITVQQPEYQYFIDIKPGRNTVHLDGHWFISQLQDYADNAVPSNLIHRILVNTGFNIETCHYHITPAANGCNGTVYNYVVTVYPTPDLSNYPA